MAQLVKNLPAMWETWVGKIPWRREQLSTPVFWPGEFHGLYSPWGHKESDMTSNFHFTSLHFTFWFFPDKYLEVELLGYRRDACTQLCLTLCDPMDCSPPCSSVHGIFQERVMEGVAISFSRESSPPRDQTCVSCIGRWILIH